MLRLMMSINKKQVVVGKDQGSRRIQIKDFWIDLEDSKGLFGSDFKLVVSKGGWSFFIRLIQDRLGSAPAAERLPGSVFSRLSLPHRSYAAAAVGRSFPLEGRCSPVQFGSVSGIKVEEHGVKERISFLECCLVFRFASLESVDWTRFRSWAHLNWGISKEASFSSVGDGLWLLFCGSKEKVSQILALNRWLFGKIAIQLDHWILDAGRSNVLMEKEAVWVRIRGIPLHLRSPALFIQIGNSCGSFLSFEDGGPLSSVRIFVRMRGVLPEEIPICFDGVIFPVRVEPESIISPSCLGDELSPERLWRSKGKASLGSFGVCRSPSQSGSSSPVTPSVALPVSCTDSEPRSLSPLRSSFDATSDFSAPEERTPSSCRLSQTLTISSAANFSPVAPLSKQFAYPFVGLRLDSNDNLVFSLDSDQVTFSFAKEGIFSFSLDSSGFSKLSRCFRWAGPSQSHWALDSSTPRFLIDSTSPTPSSSPLTFSDIETSGEIPASSSTSVYSTEDEALRSAAISRVASSIGIDLKNSFSEEDPAPNLPNSIEFRNPVLFSDSPKFGWSRHNRENCGDSILSSCQSPSSRSRTELELRRLGTSLTLPEAGSRRRKSGKVCLTSPSDI
ncbi:hypothetical protein LINPERHAP1_LOCUS4325 [Linum perenne]